MKKAIGTLDRCLSELDIKSRRLTVLSWIENQFDVVRATFSDGTNAAGMPPVRVGGGLLAYMDQSAARLRAERYRANRRERRQ